MVEVEVFLVIAEILLQCYLVVFYRTEYLNTATVFLVTGMVRHIQSAIVYLYASRRDVMVVIIVDT